MQSETSTTTLQMGVSRDAEMGTDGDERRRRWVEFFDREKYRQYVLLMRSRQFSETVELLRKWYRDCDPFRPPVELPVPTLQLTASTECEDAETSQSGKSSNSQISALSGISYTTNGSTGSSFVSVKSEVKKKTRTVAVALGLVLLLLLLSIVVGVVLHLHLDKDFFRSKSQNTNSLNSSNSLSTTMTSLPYRTSSHAMVPPALHSLSHTTDMPSKPSPNSQQSSSVLPETGLPGHAPSDTDGNRTTSVTDSPAANVTERSFERIGLLVNATDVTHVTYSRTSQSATAANANELSSTPAVNITSDAFLNKSQLNATDGASFGVESVPPVGSGGQGGTQGASTPGPAFPFADHPRQPFLKLTSSLVTILESSATQTASRINRQYSTLPQTSSSTPKTLSLSSQIPPSSSQISPSSSQIPSSSSEISSSPYKIPSSSSQIPSSLSHISSSSSQIPSSSSQIPPSSSKMPSSSSQIPSSSSQIPSSSSQIPSSSSKMPSSSSEIPFSSSRVSSLSSEIPSPSSQIPSSSSEIPFSSSQISSLSSKIPSSSSQIPSSSSEIPFSSSQIPFSSSETPSSSSQIPSSASQIPSSSSEIPSSSSQITSSSSQMLFSSSQIPSSSSKIPFSSSQIPSSSSKIPSSSSQIPSSSYQMPSSSFQIPSSASHTPYSPRKIPSSWAPISFPTTDIKKMLAPQAVTSTSSYPSPSGVNIPTSEKPISFPTFTNLFEHLHLSLTSSTHKYGESFDINPTSPHHNESSETSLGIDPALSDTGSMMNEIFNPAGAVNTFQTLTDSISSNPAQRQNAQSLETAPMNDPNTLNIENRSEQANITTESTESTSRFEQLTRSRFPPSDVTTWQIGSTASQRRDSPATTAGKGEDFGNSFLSLSQTSEEPRFSETTSGESSISFPASSNEAHNAKNETSTTGLEEHRLSDTIVKFDFSSFSGARNKSFWTGGDFSTSSGGDFSTRSGGDFSTRSGGDFSTRSGRDFSKSSGDDFSTRFQGSNNQGSVIPQRTQSSDTVLFKPQPVTDRGSRSGTRQTPGSLVKTTTTRSAHRPVAPPSRSPFHRKRKLITTTTTTLMPATINKERELEQLNAVYGNSNSPDGLSFGGSNSGPPGEVGGHAMTDYDSVIRDMPPPEVLPFAIASKVAVTPPVLTTRPPPRTQKPPKIVLITHDIVAEIGMTISGNLKVGCTAKEAWGWTYMAISRYEGENSFTLEFLGGIERRDEWPFIPIDSRMSDFTLHRDDEMVNLVLETKYAMCEDKGRYICEVNVNKTFFSKTFNVDIKKKPDKPVLSFPGEVFAGDDVTIVTTWDAGNPLIGHIVHDIVEGFTGLLFTAKNERTISWYKECAIMVENRYSVTPDLSWNGTQIIARIAPETGASLVEKSIVERVKADRKTLIVLDRKMCDNKMGQRLPNPYNAHRYISCSLAGPKVEHCPEGHGFDVTKKICVLILSKKEGGNV